jgi:O-succinylbenzoic acid--CoA ligase
MPDLVAAVLEGKRGVDTLLRVWDDGDAVMPIDPRLSDVAVARLLESMRPARLIDAREEVTKLDEPEGVEIGDALVMVTSGSTGAPKGVVHTHESTEASARATSRALGVDPTSDRWLCCLPLAHVAGLSVVLRARWAGTPVEVLSGFDAAAVDAAARERGATLTTLVPTTLQRIDPSLFRRIVVGGAAPPAELPPNAVVSYGMTETGSAVTYDGRPHEEVEVRVVDGEIQVRGPMLFRTYRGAPDPRVDDGWFPTNDAGEIDEHGRLQVKGRRGDLIISGGENIWPVPVEQAIGSHPAVHEVAVVGRPDDEWGQRVVAVVVATDPGAPPSLDELRALVADRVHPFAAPRELVVVDELPKTSLGKVLRNTL